MTQARMFAAPGHETMLRTGRPRLALRPLRAGAAMACALLAGSAGAQSSAELGFRIMASGSGGNCVACHTLPGQMGVGSTFGPALHQVGARYSADELRQWVTDARLIKPETLMPPFGTTQGTHEPIRAQSILSPDEIGHVVAALQTLR